MVFVLGAGASKPYGYPTAEELVEQIAFDQCADQSPLKKHKKFKLLQENLAHSKARSVDIFLGRDSQRDFQEVGLWTIAEKLIQCERKGNVFGRTRPSRHPDAPPRDDWYAYLFNTLTAKCQKLDDVASLPIAFITFNYDRSLEFFIKHYLRSNFPAANKGREVEDLVAGMKITHVYGRMDKFGWEAGEGGRSYEPTITREIVETAARKIRVVHEGDEDERAFQHAHQWLDIAQSVWILGFGYHPDNMRRLKLPFPRLQHFRNQSAGAHYHIYGTTYGLTNEEIGVSLLILGARTGNLAILPIELPTHFAIITFFTHWSANSMVARDDIGETTCATLMLDPFRQP
jgi:hypothetical protein